MPFALAPPPRRDRGARGPNERGSRVGLERVEDGTIQVLGIDPQRDGHVVRAQVGYVPERSEFPYRQLTIHAILEHHAAYYDSWERDYADELLEAMRLDATVKLKALSKGEARRVQIVMALAHRPPLIVLDEPTDALDPIAREQFYALLARHLATTPATVIMSTHHVAEAERLATHVGVYGADGSRRRYRAMSSRGPATLPKLLRPG